MSKMKSVGHCEKAAQPYGTWQGYKNSRGSFDWGNCAADYDAVKDDLRERAAKEQQRLDSPKRSDRDR